MDPKGYHLAETEPLKLLRIVRNGGPRDKACVLPTARQVADAFPDFRDQRDDARGLAEICSALRANHA